jgi:hypothetical protein
LAFELASVVDAVVVALSTVRYTLFARGWGRATGATCAPLDTGVLAGVAASAAAFRNFPTFDIFGMIDPCWVLLYRYLVRYVDRSINQSIGRRGLVLVA